MHNLQSVIEMAGMVRLLEETAAALVATQPSEALIRLLLASLLRERMTGATAAGECA